MKIGTDSVIAMMIFIIPFIMIATNWFMEYTGLKSNKRKQEEANNDFNRTVEHLSSENYAAQLSAAVLLRRYMTLKIGNVYYLRTETVNVISAILRTLPTGVYQKTLADGLTYAEDISGADLQRTNLQVAYIGSKKNRLKINGADLYMSNLSYALVENVEAIGAVFGQAILFGTKFRDCDLTGANFEGADLTNVVFINVTLNNAKFSKATNIPPEIIPHLKENKFIISANTTDSNIKEGKITTKRANGSNVVFFSMPGNMSINDGVIINAYREYLRQLGFDVKFYTRDTYPHSGQLSTVKCGILESVGMVAFGTRQTFINQGVYRPGMEGEKSLSGSWLSTPWNEVEVGMAVMAGIPILLVKDDAISDGIFDDVISESYIYSISAKTEMKELEHNQKFAEWLSRIRD